MKHTPLPSASTGFRPILTTLRTGPSRSQLTQPSACGWPLKASMGDEKVVSGFQKGVVNSPPRSGGFNLMHLGIRADDSARVNGPKWQFTAPKHAGCGPRIACACGRVGERQGGIVCHYLLKCEGARYRKDCAPLCGSAGTGIPTLAR